jgi:hypothetical protein
MLTIIGIDKMGQGIEPGTRCGGLALSLGKCRFDLRHEKRVAVPISIADGLQCIEHIGCGGYQAGVCAGFVAWFVVNRYCGRMNGCYQLVWITVSIRPGDDLKCRG